MKKHGAFSTVTTEGGLLPSGLLKAITSGKTNLPGTKPADYHLGIGERINEAVSRSYSRLVNAWKGFQKSLTTLPPKDLGTTITRERWLLILFQELGYGRLMTSSSIEIEGKSYPISHFWHKSPIHLVGARVNLDRRTAKAAGAARTSPHSLVQEFLNRSEECLWGFVANGLTLRILRDNASMTRQSYVEFDLAAMMEGEVYADFALLWMLCHQSRVEAETIHDCWLEQWAKQAKDQGSRALEKLREGVENAISFLGSGFLAHPANRELKDSLRSGHLSTQDYYRQLLRLVYRFLFLFVAEDRNLLLSPGVNNASREVYKRFYSMSRLRNMAGKRKGTRHADLYEGVKQVMGRLANDDGCPELGLACLGGFFWSNESIPYLVQSHIMNQDLLDAVRALTFFGDDNVMTQVDYKNLGSEELGSIYESLLELHAEANADSAIFFLQIVGGNERKTTGSYYTHPSLVQCLLDSALEPVIAEALKKSNPEQAILSLKICDPACGSGHFLVAASHRLAKRLAMVRTGDEEPAPEKVRTALRDIIGRCIYGVDINPMAVELCKVSLWMEALEPGKPLSFLDHRILCGNSLLGTTPALIKGGIPDAAFKPIEGDDKALCKALKKRNKEERQGQKSLFGPNGTAWEGIGGCHVVMVHVDAIEDSTPKGIRKKEEQYKRCVTSEGFQHAKLVADAWCAAFVWKKSEHPDLPEPITHELFKKLENNPQVLPEPMVREVHRLAGEYAFFHWHLAFPDVFAIPEKDEDPENVQTGWSGGFDCVLGNPPWEQLQLENKSTIYPAKQDIKRYYSAITNFFSTSGLLPLTCVGKKNTYSSFTELSFNIICPFGSCGIIVQSGIATDKSNGKIFQYLLKSNSIFSFIGFENKKRIFFPDIKPSLRFCLLTLSKNNVSKKKRVKFVFLAKTIGESRDINRVFYLTSDEILRLNPKTGTSPVFLCPQDALITSYIYESYPIFIPKNVRESSWKAVTRQGLFNTGSQKHEFFEETSSNMLPLYDAKMTGWLDHRSHSYSELSRTLEAVNEIQKKAFDFKTNPKCWVKQESVYRQIGNRPHNGWLLGWHRITDTNTMSRSVIPSVLPICGVADGIGLIFTDHYLSMCLTALFSSTIFDYIARQKIGGTHLDQYHVEQLSVIPPKQFEDTNCLEMTTKKYVWINKRIAELVFVSNELDAFVNEVKYDGPPFIWDDERRFLIRCELDAAFFHLYLGTNEDWISKGRHDLLKYFKTPRAAVAYIMETFPIVKHKDEQVYGHFRTKDTILEIYDEMALVMDSNQTTLAEGREPNAFYQTRLDPPPGPPCDKNGDFIPMEQWDPNNWPCHIHRPKDWTVKAEPIPVFVPYHENPQAFPWKGREQFIRDLIPHLVKHRPGLSFETYRTAAVLASRPEKLRDLLSEESAVRMDELPRQTLEVCTFPESHHFRPGEIRRSLEERKKWIIIDPKSGAVTVPQDKKISTQSKNIESFIPFVVMAAEELDRMKQDATERATKAVLNKINVFESTLTA